MSKKEKKNLKEVDFDIIRYANCWEDADLLLKGLDLDENNNILSIGSGGDNSFSLLTTNPKKVVAVDVSEVQLFLIELKKQAILLLNRNEYLAFIGFHVQDGNTRMETYQNIRPQLSDVCKKYWDSQLETIKAGIVHQGKFEKYFQLFSKRVIPLIHSKKKVRELLKEKSEADQAAFFHKSWDTWRWRMFFKAFFSRFIMGRLGRDKSFMKEFEGSVSTFILNQAKRHLSSKHVHDNFMLNYALTGSFLDKLPHYVQEENYEKVKQNLDKLTLINGFAKDAIEQHGPFDAFNLSNIFEYLNKETFASVQKELIEGGTEHAKYAYWNLMVDRIMSNNKAYRLTNKTKEHLAKDKGFFYKRFVVDCK